MTEHIPTDFEILKDQPLLHKDLDRFGYSDIAKALISIIKKATPPFTIGLYGQWGVGKSTICKLVESSFENDSDYKIFYFDTWKYERDSFRRQFLIELDRDVFENKLDYKNKLNQSLTLPHIPPFWKFLKESFRSSFQIIILRFSILFVLLSLLLGGMFLLNHFVYHFLTTGFRETIGILINSFTIIGFTLLVGKFLLESMHLFKGELEIPRTDSAEGFEYYYEEALKELKGKKLLIVIDNLDRLEASRAVELLSDIKTFLADEKIDHTNNRTIFLIPCDNHALSNQLKVIYRDLNTEEYLRKFFNLPIRIPRLLDLELDDYVAEKLRETKIPEFNNNQSLSFVIGRVCRNNPREIIQFINSLTSLFLLARSRGLKQICEREKIPFLAKILAIRIKWPEIYNIVEAEIFRTGSDLAEVVQIFLNNHSRLDEEVINKESLDTFVAFITTTEIIKEDELSHGIFFAIKETEGEAKVPGWNAFILAAEDRDKENLEIAYQNIFKQNKISELASCLQGYVDKNKNKETKLLNVLISVSDFIDKDNLKIFEPFVRSIFIHLTPPIITSALSVVDIKFLFNPSFKDLSSHVKKVIRNKLVGVTEVLGSTDRADVSNVKNDLSLWDTLSSYKSIFEGRSIADTQIRNTFIVSKGTYIRHIRINALFPQKPSDQIFLTNLLNFVYMEYPTERSLYAAVCEFSSSILQYAPLQDKKDLILILNRILFFFKTIKIPEKIENTESAAFRQLTSQLHVLSNSSDWDIKSLTIRVLLRLDAPENPQRNEMYTRIGSFIADQGNSEERINETFSIEEMKNLLMLQKIREPFINRTSNNPNLFIALGFKNFFNDEEMRLILTNLMRQKAPEFLKFIKYIDYQVPVNFKSELILGMIRQLNFSDHNILNEWLGVIEKLGMQSSHLQEFINYLRNSWNSHGKDHKEIIAHFVKSNEKFFGDALVQEFSV